MHVFNKQVGDCARILNLPNPVYEFEFTKTRYGHVSILNMETEIPVQVKCGDAYEGLCKC